MGEVVVSSEEVEEVRTESETEKENGEFEGNKRRKKKPGSSASGEVVKLERFLPRMALRVLLVEADDSTRQIIAALLRKCSYSVAAVPDGLKAWEMLKGKPHNIDLILTEVDLPSISGFALLTLIMEHEICKSVPVIMMSSQDSISTVYKCMLKGAADYLVKPIRRNELRNLWQHVWRRQSLIVDGNSSQDESVGQKRVEATAENNAASNHSSGCLACVQRNKEQTEKGSDAQSSCTKPDMEAESAHMENMQEFSDLTKGKSLPSESQKLEARADFYRKLLMHEMETGVVDACKDACTTTVYKGVELESQRGDTNISVEAGDTLVDSPREAIDLMGTFNRNWNSSSINGTSKFDFSSHLDLSLRGCNPNVFENHVTQERPALWHPNSSAFTRYTSRLLQPLHSTLTSVSDQKKESMNNSEKMLSNIISEYNSDTPSPTLASQRNMIPLTTGATGELKQTKVAASCTQQRVFSVPVPVKGIRLNNLCDGYNSVIPPIFCAQSSSSPMPSPSSANQQEPAFCVNLFRHSSFETDSSRQLYDRLASNTNQSNQHLHKLDPKLDSIEDRGHISPTTDQSASSSFCNGSLSQLKCIAYGSTGASNGNVDQVAIVRASTLSKNDDSFPSPGGNSHRSIQREAALTKFRLKRKDRCYEKKVRYESRKKLAEQRPRVKGQFVRQVQADPMHSEAECHWLVTTL
ncbi:hypothetical protein CRYUN_Cryun19dG0098500 [Craigia yunnanensis]